MTKYLLLSSTLAVGVLLATIFAFKGSSQSPPGFLAIMTDFYNCNPEKMACSPGMVSTVKELPDGSRSQYMTRPDGQHIKLIKTGTQHIHVYPDSQQWYALTLAHAPGKISMSHPTQCSDAASGVTGTTVRTFVDEEKVAGFTAYKYDRVMPQTGSSSASPHVYSWYFPDIGCAEMQTYMLFPDGASTYQKLMSLTLGYNDPSVLTPVGKETAPVTIFHDLYIKAHTTGTMAVSPDQAEAGWIALWQDPNRMQAERTQESWWEKTHPAP